MTCPPRSDPRLPGGTLHARGARLPVGSLLDWLAEHHISIAEMGRAGWELNSYGRRHGLSVPVADRVAVQVLHVHPAEIWPEWFDDEGDAA